MYNIMSDNEKPNIMTFIKNLYQCKTAPSEKMSDESETSDKVPEENINNLWSAYKREKKIPDKWTLPFGAITNASELKLCNFYSLYQILPPGYTEKLIDVKLTQEYTGIIEPPFYFVEKKRWFNFGMGGKQSRKYRKKRRHTRRRKSHKSRK